MKRNIQNQHEAFFIVRNLLGKRSLEIDTYLLGPFYSRSEARERLIAIHETTIRQQHDNIECISLEDDGEFSKVETDLVTFSLQIFHKPLFQ